MVAVALLGELLSKREMDSNGAQPKPLCVSLYNRKNFHKKKSRQPEVSHMTGKIGETHQAVSCRKTCRIGFQYTPPTGQLITPTGFQLEGLSCLRHTGGAITS